MAQNLAAGMAATADGSVACLTIRGSAGLTLGSRRAEHGLMAGPADLTSLQQGRQGQWRGATSHIYVTLRHANSPAPIALCGPWLRLLSPGPPSGVLCVALRRRHRCCRRRCRLRGPPPAAHAPQAAPACPMLAGGRNRAGGRGQRCGSGRRGRPPAA